jgi:hypothetical protein
VTWEDALVQDMNQAAQRTAERSAHLARTMAAREVKIAELWRRIDLILERVNSRVPAGGQHFTCEESADRTRRTVRFGARTLAFEVEPLVYDTWRNEPAFYPGGLARVYVEPPARDLTALFCAVSDEGARWLVMPTGHPLTDEIIVLLLRTLLT